VAIFTNVRDKNGRIGDLSNILETFLYEAAVELQQKTAELIDDRTIRKEVSTGRLIRATRDRRNRKTTNSSMEVGIAEFLDGVTHVGRYGRGGYHRLVEEGSAGTAYLGPMVSKPDGIPLYGRWKPGEPSGYGAPGDQKLYPFRYAKRAKLFEINKLKGDPYIPYRDRDIEGMWAYRDAWDQVNPVAKVRARWAAYLRQQGFAAGSGPLPKAYRI
jgi:hypothetical protein